MAFIDYVFDKTIEYIENMPKSIRKTYGQFFTSKETALFMAGLFELPKNKRTVKVLDAGAGSGVLSVALIDRLINESTIQQIDVVCYETDSNIEQLLKDNLEWVSKTSAVQINYEVRTENYILSQIFEYNNWLGANPTPEKFDIIIGNPPYKKIAKDAPEAKAMQDVCYGAPNMYFLFTAMGIFNLKQESEMVYIIPRSWTSGAYFNKFRKKLLYECVLEHIHLFKSRDKVFDKESVLQETIIIKVRKTRKKPETICVTTTNSNTDFSTLTSFRVPYDVIVSNTNSYVYLVTDSQEIEVLKTLQHWTDTLPKIGLPMKTGLTVDFRNKDTLRDFAEDNAVPLFYSQHIKDGKVVFPIGKDKEYIVTNKKGLLQENANYLFVKRFTAKEERRRLQCGVYLSRMHPEYKQISTQNKINFIGGLHSLSECIVYGLYVLFNSTIYDKYYRILNGSTQVNSTEINSMPVPSRETIEEMGKKLIAEHDTSVEMCDRIIRSFISEKDRRSQSNLERVASAS